ncbi:MBL fold metallo-hydrolase [Aquidulcibacter paucihalophilus]|nr:MBL fold metallo-hydrolase [Aquidulcibacter paucihalophilus]
MRLTVHRATDQIGGNCIELSTAEGRIILDVGRPLDAPNDAVGLLPATLDRDRPLDGVLVSHPHQDHYGLLEETPAHWPVYSGAATERLMQLTASIFGKPMQRDFRSWTTGQANQIGPFTVTPYLTDHSAFDAHMLLIEAAGKRVLYSGDFRTHGRKSKLVERLMGSPPPDIDVLLMEGTNLGSDKQCMTETDLEDDYVALFRATKGRVFVAWSAQNIDRTVTLYRACLKTKRTLVIDLYTAEVLDALAAHGRLPQPDWSSIKVVITSAFSRLYKRKGEEVFVTRMAGNGISAKALAASPEKWVIMVRPSLIKDYEPAGVSPTADDAWSYAMWRGYLKNEDGQRLQNWFDQGGAAAKHLHTSGHASPSDLRAFANAMKPKTMVPIHGVAWDTDVEGFPPITRLVDGQPLEL